MSQHDFNIANQGFPATRADINNAFQAIASNSSGPTAPSTTYANQWWYDTTNNKMYLRNEADSAWIEVATIDQTNNEWQITTGQITAADSDGFIIKTDDGTARFTMDDTGDVTFANDVTVDGTFAASNFPSVGALSNRNVIINGRFDVWQRSVGPVTGSGYTTVDRWRFPASGITSEQVSNDRDLSIPYALKVTADGTGYGITQTRIEDARTLSGKQATFSIWVKSPTTGSFRFFIEQNFGSGGSSTVSILDNASQFSIASANTWEQFTVTVTMPSVSGKTFGSGHHVSLGIGANSGTANRVMYYSEAQLEVGDTATPFEHRSYGDELSRCQRYYMDLSGQTYWTGFSDGNTTTRVSVVGQFPVTMRASPSITYTAGAVGSPLTGSTNIYGFNYIFNTTAANRGGTTYINDVKVDAEL